MDQWSPTPSPSRLHFTERLIQHTRHLDQFRTRNVRIALDAAAACGKAAFVLDRNTVGNVRDLVRACANT